MSPPRPTRDERLYRLLLRLYPLSFRERYEEELVDCFRRDRDRPRFRGATGAFRFWWHTLGDLVRTAASERRGRGPRARRPRRSAVSAIVSDVRFAFRAMHRNARDTVLAALTLAIGIGASTAIWSVTKRVLLDPLPYRDGDRLALIWSEMPRSGFTRYPISGPELDDLRTKTDVFEDLASIWTTVGALVENEEPEMVRLGLVTWNFPSILGAEPVLGRLFEPADEGTGSSHVLISEGLWRRRFGGERSILGQRLRIDGGWGFGGGTFTVVGVLPDSFRLVLPSDAGVATRLDVWAPFGSSLASGPRGLYYLRTLGRLRDGVGIELAQREVKALGERIQSEFPEYDATGRGLNAVLLKEDSIGRARPVLLALVVGTGFLLLVACANVANLLLARATDRREEMLLRTALGATRRQIGLQLLVESLVLASLGGVGGLLLGSAALRPLLLLAPGLPRTEAIGVDPLVLVVAFGASLSCGVLFGLAPIAASRRQQLYSALRSGSGAVAGGQRARGLLVVAELGLASVLMVGALLCFRTLEALERVDLGFDTERILTMELTLPNGRYGTGPDLAAFTRELERRIEEIPGVEAAGAINQLPLSDLPNWSSPYRARDEGRSEGETNEADGRVVTPGYFETVGARLVEGRFFDESDDSEDRHVAVVDTRLASRLWPDTSALGREIEIQVRKERGFVTVWAEVVGVVAHMRHHDPRFELREQFFVPFAQGARNQMALAVRTEGTPESVVERVRSELKEMDRDMAVSNVRPLQDYAGDALAVQRFTMALAAAFAGVAVFLGCFGLYGVVAQAVSARRREIGLRLALGATAPGIARAVLGRSLALVGAGIALGLPLALGLGRFLGAILFGVEATDPRVLALVPALLAVVAMAASFFPARRATRIDPAVVLRQE